MRISIALGSLVGRFAGLSCWRNGRLGWISRADLHVRLRWRHENRLWHDGRPLSRRGRRGRLELRLRLLGASHQVICGDLTETVACLPGHPPHLPDALHDETAGYRFTATVLRPAGDGLRTRVAALRAELAGDPYALVGVFPGDEDAVTALAVRPAPPDGSVAWRTWHAYPQTNELVLTETVVEL